ncbi:MAG: glycosyltransferase family 4 protein [Ilumatobacteraceae bacterium]
MLRIALVTQGDPDRVSGGSIYHRRIAELADAHGAEIRFVVMPSRPFPLAIVDGPAALREAREGADVMVVDSLASNTLGPWISAGLGRDVPIVGSVHQDVGGVDSGAVRRVLQARLDRMAWAGAAHLVVPSEHLAAQLVAHGLDRSTITVVQPGRDLPLPRVDHRAVPAVDLRRGRRTALLCVASWLPNKGVVELLDAVAALPEPLAMLHLVGDEDVDRPYRRRVLQRLDRYRFDGRVVRHGIVAPEDIGALYAAADAFVLASASESYGMVYGEAMVAGLPIVGWAGGNLANLVDDGVEGRVVPTGDGEGLIAALVELSTDGAMRERLGHAARVRAAGLPTWAETAERFFTVCREVAAVAHAR